MSTGASGGFGATAAIPYCGGLVRSGRFNVQHSAGSRNLRFRGADLMTEDYVDFNKGDVNDPATLGG